VSTLIAFGQDDDHAKPIILGFDHGVNMLSILLAILVIALACSHARLAFVISVAVVPLLVFAAALVRFALAALIATLACGFIIAPTSRRRMAVLAGIGAVVIVTGFMLRPSLALEYVRYIQDSFGPARPVQQAATGEQPTVARTHRPSLANWIPAKGCPDINLNNSIDMRKQLMKDSVALLPSAGLFGIGLGGFPARSCIGAEPHNSFLQTAIELGIPAGIILVLLVLSVSLPLLRRATFDQGALLALLSLVYVVLIALAHGRIAEDSVLFAIIGYAAAYYAQPAARPAMLPTDS
jgi:hypothetical protein